MREDQKAAKFDPKVEPNPADPFRITKGDRHKQPRNQDWNEILLEPCRWKMAKHARHKGYPAINH
ncbi:MAG: hypothetical protein H6715_00750 [Myxococcales bacterium]|nr:hypothetical protein [Myxococcales bacterium]